MNEKLLEEIGLTKGEIKVYLTLLKTGETTTGKIVEEAQISSGKIYEILDKLIKKGLASFIIKEKTKYFQASSPNRILDYIQEKEKSLKEKEKEIIRELPYLIELEKSKEQKEEIRLFKGFKGVQTIIFEALSELTSKDEVLAMGVFSKKPEQFNLLWPKWHMERIKNKIRCRIIFSEKGTEYSDSFKKMRYTDLKFIEGLTPAAVDVIGNRALIFTYGKDPTCLSIKNLEIVQSFRTFFEALWKKAKK
jgi:HTH-type transcriptional regulator, sugar sensing transcriptional regulator